MRLWYTHLVHRVVSHRGPTRVGRGPVSRATARPSRYPRSGVYYFRRRVPAHLAGQFGRTVEKRSLGTKYPSEARIRFAEIAAEFDELWHVSSSAVYGDSGSEAEVTRHDLEAGDERDVQEYLLDNSHALIPRSPRRAVSRPPLSAAALWVRARRWLGGVAFRQPCRDGEDQRRGG